MYNIYHEAPHTNGSSQIPHFLLFIILVYLFKS